MRNNLLDQLGQQYVMTARAKGMEEPKLVRKYPVKIALNPLISDFGMLVYGIVAGQGLIGIVLGLPTLGPLLLQFLAGARHDPGRHHPADLRQRNLAGDLGVGYSAGLV